MTGHARQPWTSSRLWFVVLAALLALRLPAIVEPTGSDQGLYMYSAERILDGGAPYLDAWDQKPPGVFFVYAAFRMVWPHASVVALADLAAAGLTAILLVAMTRRSLGDGVAFLTAGVFLLFSHPSIARVSGIYVRGQCEVFIAAAVTAALVTVWRDRVSRPQLVAAGVGLGVAIWLKYNAVTYALPLAVAFLQPPGGQRRNLRDLVAATPWIVAGVAGVSSFFLLFLAAHGALMDWWLATISYNLAYSGETYETRAGGPLSYLLTMPLERMRADLLWFFGAIGALLFLLGGHQQKRAASVVAAAWMLAALGSIALNGARDLPQYFVQAGPALAFLFGGGIATLPGRSRLLAGAATALVVLGLWRVGTDAAGIGGLRWGGLPELVRNVTFDAAHLAGRVDRRTYLARFKGAQKYDALESDDLAALVRTSTRPDDRIFVFGFAPAVYLESGRLSASRFFWSRPVVIEFAADREGYGSTGLLADLDRASPAVVALQKQDWGPGEPNSEAFFRNTPRLGNWLREHYDLERDTAFFSVWRRRSRS